MNGILSKDDKYIPVLGLLPARRLMRDFLVSVLRIGTFSKHRFSHELRLFFILGYLSGRTKRKSL